MTAKMILSKLPIEMQETIILMDSFNGKIIPKNKKDFINNFMRFLESRTGSAQASDEELKRLNIDTDEKLQYIAGIYIALRKKYPDLLFYMQARNGRNPNISEAALTIIDRIIQNSPDISKEQIMSVVCKTLELRYGTGAQLEKKLHKMNLKRTSNIMHVIDIYYVMKTLYPETAFRYGIDDWAPFIDKAIENEIYDRKKKGALK